MQMKVYNSDWDAYLEGKRRWLFRNPLKCEPVLMNHYAWHFAFHRTQTRYSNKMRLQYWKQMTLKQQKQFNASFK